MPKRIQHDKISIERNNETYEGLRTIEGTRKLFQTILYAGLSERDNNSYKPDEKDYMNRMARLILGELVNKSRRE